mmetsp:Transcript_52163/g.82828  ORF Transcript_52163/g.82828 Transcript_52163/m.82828 type:complete len:226 (-) Transcript_52163:639-1316(-)
MGLCKDGIISLLHVPKTSTHSVLHFRWNEVWVSLENYEFALLLGFQNFEGFWIEAWCDDTIAYLNLQNHRCCHVHFMRNSHEVTEGTHRIGISRSNISCCSCCHLLVFHFEDESFIIAQSSADGSTCWADMLERRGCRHSCSLGQLEHQLPRIDRIQQINVSGNASQDFERQLASTNSAKTSRKLMRVATVFQWALDLKGDCMRLRWLGDLLRHPSAHHGVIRCC